MNLLVETVGEFARDLGFKEFNWDGESVLSFTVERVGTLSIERHNDDQVLVTLEKKVPAVTEKLLRRSLSICYWEERQSYPFNCGMYDDRLIYGVNLAVNELTAPLLGTLMEALNRLHQRAVMVLSL